MAPARGHSPTQPRATTRPDRHAASLNRARSTSDSPNAAVATIRMVADDVFDAQVAKREQRVDRRRVAHRLDDRRVERRSNTAVSVHDRAAVLERLQHARRVIVVKPIGRQMTAPVPGCARSQRPAFEVSAGGWERYRPVANSRRSPPAGGAATIGAHARTASDRPNADSRQRRVPHKREHRETRGRANRLHPEKHVIQAGIQRSNAVGPKDRTTRDATIA